MVKMVSPWDPQAMAKLETPKRRNQIKGFVPLISFLVSSLKVPLRRMEYDGITGFCDETICSGHQGCHKVSAQIWCQNLQGQHLSDAFGSSLQIKRPSWIFWMLIHSCLQRPKLQRSETGRHRILPIGVPDFFGSNQSSTFFGQPKAYQYSLRIPTANATWFLPKFGTRKLEKIPLKKAHSYIRMSA